MGCRCYITITICSAIAVFRKRQSSRLETWHRPTLAISALPIQSADPDPGRGHRVLEPTQSRRECGDQAGARARGRDDPGGDQPVASLLAESPASAADIEFFREGIGDGCRAGTEFAAWLALREAADWETIVSDPAAPLSIWAGRSDGGSGAEVKSKVMG